MSKQGLQYALIFILLLLLIFCSVFYYTKNATVIQGQNNFSTEFDPNTINVKAFNIEKTLAELEVKYDDITQPSKNHYASLPEPIKVSDQAIAPVVNQIKTDKPVIFLGIDDGEVTFPETLKFFQDRKWPVTLFINKIHYDKNINYFKSILDTGANLGNHTMNHPNLITLNYEQQKKEICDSQESYQKDFGIKPKLFRPPFGNYNKNTQQAVKDCGMIAILNWKARVDEGKMWYQVGDKLNKGEIVLMHFRPQMMDDLKAFEDEINRQGLEVGDLSKWVE
jgi:peptidoglycan/xylan/chitin deacetylase (PgdA/CDA1 family)